MPAGIPFFSGGNTCIMARALRMSGLCSRTQGLHQTIFLIGFPADERHLPRGALFTQRQYAHGMHGVDVRTGVRQNGHPQSLGYQRGERGQRLQFQSAASVRGVLSDVTRG